MIEDEFSDFLDSDDDALFLEASNSLLDCNAAPSDSGISQVTTLPEKEKIAAHQSSSEGVFLEGKQGTSPTCKLQKSGMCMHKNSSLDAKTEVSEFEAYNRTTNLYNSPWQCSATSYINNRFTPGFTPTAKKRKFAGPAGLFDLNDKTEETFYSNESKTIFVDSDHIPNSQFSPEHLSSASWQKLQADVSSHINLHSTAKFYSIQRVLLESSKKKLPKHMVVPVLCVLLKELKNKSSSLLPIFMDDTGEINGKVDAEFMSKYCKYVVEGAAFILKKVTFLCNVLLLKVDNLVSVYLPDGSESHIQNLESVLDSSEPLKPMNCECLKLKDVNRNSHISKTPDSNVHHRTSCVGYISKNKSNPIQRNMPCKVHPNVKTSLKEVTKPSTLINSKRSDEYLEDMLNDNCLDEILGNLDEKSFLEEL